MAFLLIAIARFIQRFMQIDKFLTLTCVGLVSLYFGGYSYLLNKNLWHDESTFLNREVQQFHNYLYAGGLAEALLDERKYQDAERYFQIAINDYPNKAKNYINYSALLMETGRKNKALFFLNEAKSLKMTHRERGEWFNNMGMACFNLGKNEEAIRNFRKAVMFSPNEAQFWANLGGAYGSAGDYENSLAALKKGLEIAPDSLRLRKNLAVTYLRMGNPAMASSILEKIPPSQRAEQGVIELLNEAYRALESNRRKDDNGENAEG